MKPPSRAAALMTASQLCVRRAARPGGLEFYPVRLTQPLPCVRIPLRADDEDPLLDLGVVFREAHDRSMVVTGIDYTTEPDPPLNREDAAWAYALLRQAGLRGPGGAAGC